MAQKTVTAVGNAQLDTAQKKFGTASGLFDGTGDYLTVPGDADFAFGTGDFTIEFFLRFASVSAVTFITFSGSDNGATTDAPYFQYFGGNLDFGRNNVGVINSSAWTPSTGTWYHVAAARSGTTCKTFVDGVQQNSATNSTSLTQLDLRIASAGGGSLNGWIDELRITKGFARYTTNFTPPTAPTTYDARDGLRLHFDGAGGSTTFTDSSADTTDVLATPFVKTRNINQAIHRSNYY